MRRSHLSLLGTLAVTAVLMTACAGTTAAPHKMPHNPSSTAVVAPPSQGSGSVTVQGPPGGSTSPTDPHLAACDSELAGVGVPAEDLPAFDHGAQPPSTWPTVTLARSTSGGAVVPSAQDASSIQTATWNLLSTSVGLALTPYFGETLTVVNGSDQNGETCLEDGTKVVGAYDVALSGGQEPFAYVSVLGKSVLDLEGVDYLTWLEKAGAYAPAPAPLTPAMTPLASLQDFFDTLNSHPPASEDAALEKTFFTSTSPQPASTFFSEFTFWVPLRITGNSCPYGVTSSPTEATYLVLLWPDYASQPLLAGNGFTAEFISLGRPDTASVWKITGMATGC